MHASPVLVVGPTNTPSDVARLRAYAFDVATELGAPATYATHNEYRVTDFAAVYSMTPSTSLNDRVGLLLTAEALLAGIPVHEPLSAAETVECPCGLVCRTVRPEVVDGEPVCAECMGDSSCTWCYEWSDTEDLDVVEFGETWVPLHAGCRAGMERDTRPVWLFTVAA